MVKKQKFLRNLLTSVSVASIVASIGGSSVAFAENAQVVGVVNLSDIWDRRPDPKGTDWVAFNAAGGQLTVDPKSPVAIDGIDVRGDTATITINNGITIGHILNGGHTVAATISAAQTLTLGKEKHTGLGVTKLDGAGSTLRLENDATIHKEVTTTADGQGVLTFEGAGTSAGAIGTAIAALAEVNIGVAGAGAAVVTLKEDVFTKKLNFAVAGREVQIAGNFGGGAKADGNPGAAGEVDFGAAGGTLTFNALVTEPKTFNSTIVNGDNGTLNVQGNLTATHADIGKINTINIGTARGVTGAIPQPGILAIDASGGNVNLLDETAAGAGLGAAINFLDKNSKLRLYTKGADRTITFHKDLEGFPDGGGIVVLQGTDANTLVVQSKDGTKYLGTKDDPLDELQVRGNVTIIGEYNFDDDDDEVDVVNEIDVRNAKKLNIIKGAIFLDKSLTSQDIPEIHIGANDGTGTGRANYILDTQYYDFNILSDGSRIIFDDPDAQLTLRNSGIYNNSVTFNNNLEGFDHPNGGGVVLLQSTDANSLTVQSDNGERTLGTKEKKLKELQVRGNVIIREMDDAAAAVAEAARIDDGDPIVANRLNVSNVHKLNVIKGAVFTDESSTSANIGEIHIGADDGILGGGKGKANYILDAIYGDFGILADKGVGVGNNEIIFDDATAQLTLRNSSAAENRTIIFNNSLEGFSDVGVDHGGIVSLEGIGRTLFVQSAAGIKTLGIVGATLDELQVRGQVTILGTDTKKLDFSNVNALNIMNGATFTDESTTSANIGEIHIGADDGIAAALGGGKGKANYILDAKYGDFGILAPKGVGVVGNNEIIFDDATAQLTLRNGSAAENRTITFHDNLAGLVPIGGGVGNGGIVVMEGSNRKDKILFVRSDNGTRTLGTNDNQLDELQVRGNVTIRGMDVVTAGILGVNASKLDVRNARVLNVINGAIFTDESATSAQIGTINIGANGDGGVGRATYIIDTKYNDNVEILNGKTITFKAADAQLTLRNSHKTEDRTIIFHDHLAGFSDAGGGLVVDHGGIVSLEGTNGNTLFVRSAAGGVRTLGTADHNIGELQVRGHVTVKGDADKFDVSKAKILNVIKGAVFTDESTTSAQIGEINIGVKATPGGKEGPAYYILDAKHNEFSILDGANNINFLNDSANLILRNSHAADNKTITLARALDPRNNSKGIVQLESVLAGKLTIAGVHSLGTNIHRLKEIRITGAIVDIKPAIYAKTITLDVVQLTTNAVNGDINFLVNTEFTANDNIGNVNFNATAGTITLADGKSIGTVKGDGNNGTLNFAGAGGAGAITGIAAVNFKGAGDVHLRHVGNAARAKTFTFEENANVTAHGGIEGNVAFHHNDDNGGTLILADDKRITGTVDNITGVANRGTLTFLGTGEVTDRIGEHNALMAVNFDGIGNVHLRHVGNAARAKTFTFKKNATVTAHGGIKGNVDFNYDNDNGGTLNLAANKSITGTVDNTSGNANRGTLIFLGAGTVTENIGATKALAEIRIGVGDVELQKNVATNNLNFANAQTVKIGGDFTGGVNFNGGGTLIFNKPVGALPTTFNSTIANGNNGILNVQTNLTATNAQIGNIKIINIGTAAPPPGAAGFLTIDATAGDVALLGNGGGADQVINFKHIGSVLGLYANAAGKIITFHDHLAGGVGGGVADGGIVLLEGAGNTLTVQSKTGGETLGIAGNKLATLEVRGQVTILGGIHKLDIHNTLELDIIKEAVFTDESATSAAIPIINIGEKATYVLDAKHVNNINILAPGTAIHFLHEKAKLTLRNSDNNNKTIILANTLDPGGINKGIVEFDSVLANTTLTIDGVGSLGTKGHELNEVIFSGDGKFKIAPHIYTTNIMLNAHAVELGDVTSDITFVKDTTLNANGHINGSVDFANHAGIINLKADKNITGSVTGANGTLECLGVGSVGGLITNLGMLKAGKGDVTLVVAGNHVIKEIQGNGEQSLIFASGFNLTGDINLTGGQAVGLIFNGDGNISGGVGTHSSVGNIQIVKAGTVAFGSLIKARDIDISGGATAEIVENTTATNIKGGGKVKFNNKKELILDTPISIDTMEVAGTNVKIIKAVSGSNIHFSGSDPVTLTLEASSNVNNITAGGNGVHSMALAADFTTTGNIGSESNRLKEIKLLGDHTFSIKGSIYSPILTTTDNSGKVIFNLNDSVAYGNLGEEKLRLADVTFDSNSTVKGDVYSKKITIKGDKTATFAGTNTKTTIDVPGVSRKKFTYGTEIVSEEINAGSSSKIHFGSAALVNAPINGGQVELTDNVWFKEKVTSAAPVTFAADKYVILEQDVKFASIAANQAKIIMLGETQTIAGDLTAKDLTMDLGTSQVKYDNTAKLTGELKLRSFYDSSKLAGGNIEIQSNGKLDLSQLDKLLVTIVGQTDISKMPEDTQYVLISSVDGNNGISSLDPSKITLDTTNEQNRFVSWTIDPSNLTLHAKDIHKKVLKEEIEELKEKLEKTQDSAVASRLLKRATLLEQLHDVTDKNSDAFKYSDEIGKMDKENADLSVDKLLPGNTNPISMELAFMVSEAISQVTSQIASRSVNMLPVASGDDDKVTYGVWGSPFYAVGNQEMRKGISGYRSKSIGGIFGFDGLINDDLLVGVAYSKIDTKMSHKDLKFGDKTNGTTNLFSLYGSYKFPSNFFAEAVASYGITDIKNAEGRVVLDANKKVTTGTAVAKYKSTSYSGQLLTGYNYQPSEKLTITPTIGLRYSQFMDDGHVESGTAYQNLTVKKKTSYNKFEGILGLRTATNIQLDQLLLIPELHGYVNYDFKGKSPIIDARLGGMNEPFPTQSVKPTKVSFTVGTGLTVKSNMMEYGVTYNAHIADKYIGHQGSLKVKVNF